jgi:hypothetical protein
MIFFFFFFFFSFFFLLFFFPRCSKGAKGYGFGTYRESLSSIDDERFFVSFPPLFDSSCEGRPTASFTGASFFFSTPAYLLLSKRSTLIAIRRNLLVFTCLRCSGPTWVHTDAMFSLRNL